jgi:hypothetical protein
LVTVTNNTTTAPAIAFPGPLTLTAGPVVNRATGAGAFTVISGGSCVAGLVLQPGGSCTVNVQYVPPTTGSLTSTAHVTITDTGATTATQNSANFPAN